MTCAEPLRGDHAAQADRAITDDRGNLAGAHVRSNGGVMAGPHHVREREQRRHQRVVLADRQNDKRPVRLRYTHCFGLCPRDVNRSEEPAVDA